MKQNLLFIIIPIYNVERYLRECLESVANQTYTNFKAILINDGSTDSSPQIAQEYCEKDSRFTLLNQHNQGLSAARNAGLDYIKCKWGGVQPPSDTGDTNDTRKTLESSYIFFIDSDDYIRENALEIIVDRLDGVDAVLFNNLTKHDMSNGELTEWEDMFIKESLEDRVFTPLELLQIQEISLYCVYQLIIKTSLLLDSGIIFEPHILHEDILFMDTIFAKLNNLRISKNSIYYYRTNRSGSIMNTRFDKARIALTLNSYFTITKRYYELYSIQTNELFKRHFYRNGEYRANELLMTLLAQYGYINGLQFSRRDLLELPYFRKKKLKVFFPIFFPRTRLFFAEIYLFLKNIERKIRHLRKNIINNKSRK